MLLTTLAAHASLQYYSDCDITSQSLQVYGRLTHGVYEKQPLRRTSESRAEEFTMSDAGDNGPTRPHDGTDRADHDFTVRLRVNGRAHDLRLDPRVSLLDAFREQLHLTGTKKGCNQGACGACTILADGERILSCLALAVQYDGRDLTTIEGLATDHLHPLQAAFVEHDGFQCGYCTPGQICSAIGMAGEIKRGEPSAVTEDVTAYSIDLNDEEIRERMSGNLCRCGAYNGIVEAVRETFAEELAS